MANPAPNADLLLGILPGSAAEEAHRRRGEGAHPDSFKGAFARHLKRIQSAVITGAVRVTATILEYDVANGETQAAPAIFQGFRKPASGTSGIRDPDLAALLASTMAVAVGRAEDAREADAVRRTVAALPASGRVTWLGAMPGREPRMIRLLLGGFEAANLPADLRRLGWPGESDAVASLLDGLGDRRGPIALQLEASANGIHPSLGVELYMPEDDAGTRGPVHWATRPDPSPWRALLARLREADLCLEPKATALLAFPGRELVFAETVFEALVGISHVKLGIGESTPAGAKAYLGMLLRPAGA